MQNEIEQGTEIIIFDKKFKIYGDIDNPRFLAADVADMIEYSPDKVGQMLENVDDDEKLTDIVYRGGQNREMWFLTEFGFYELLMQSRKPLARSFKAKVKMILRDIRLGKPNSAVVSRQDNTLTMENVRLIFRNFAGEASTYNRAGDRNFCVIIDDPELAQQLLIDGWNVKSLKARDEDEEPAKYIKVSVRFDNYPPKVYMKSGRTKTLLDENTIDTLDFAEFSNVDLILSGSDWDVNGKTGIKAYLKSMYATIREDRLASKYFDEEEAPFN